MLFFTISLSVISLAFGWSLTETSVSSYVTTQKDYGMLDHVIESHMTKDLIACAQLCLSNELCASFNFRKTISFKEASCDLNNHKYETGNLTFKKGWTFGEWINVATEQYIFTTLGAQGISGPSELQLGGYNSTSLEGQVNIVGGIQHWKIPISGTYTIEALGASGSNGTCNGCQKWILGGQGARVKGRFFFSKGTKLNVLVGQKGLPLDAFSLRPGSGGGGTFVTYADNTKIIIAGGGGGGGIPDPGYGAGDPGQATQNGSRYGGVDGTGGWRYHSVNHTLDLAGVIQASTGAGYKGDGDSGTVGTPAISFLSGGTGGYFFTFKYGGFGGGGFGLTHGGGGGGYSGGGIVGTKSSGTAGGGGSYNSGSAQTNEPGVNSGDGKVIITLFK